MSISHLRRYHLNLLVVFDALIELRSATRVAAMLHTTQPAISRSLAQLRQILGDPLLVSVRGGLEPTARALELRPLVRDALASLDAILGPSAAAGESELRRVFNIVSSSSIELGLAPELLPWLDESMPSVMARFSIVPSGVGIPEALLDDGEADLAIGRFSTKPARLMLMPLFRSRRVCIVRSDHPCRAKRLTPEQTAALDYVTISNMTERQNEVDLLLQEWGLSRRINLFITNSGIAPFVLMKSNYAALVPLHAARQLAGRFALRIIELPRNRQPNEYSMVWHRRWDDSPAHRRVREQVARITSAWDQKLDTGGAG